MPPKGGNPMLKDPQILDIIAYLRTLEIPIAPIGENTRAATREKVAVVSAPVEPTTPVSFIDNVPRSTVPHAMDSPSGLAPESASEAQRMAVYVRPAVPQLDEKRPANAHLFLRSLLSHDWVARYPRLGWDGCTRMVDVESKPW